ncbi:uncharacterized protein BJ212DRAFT_1283686 [Suillus subaureus]|uniref:Uncharacterized protein n=1 Tax=Suillus subaureus TaxID=48587 RepID=A0A9P7DGK6_9AGAM|nr:uncharacterized protein BJ212DRAFT_1293716 [Suillus subaureus]XP_041187234.1 uncharacterized protein BJ212DRAFT_1283686 [Suillus subaureus]KAG1791780.1 hypothetical protein BJ212DRAFT_1293716 [Suillus subaureus]KAG1805451.1 hypothetical protein BJ212DRAFT_1283686 [Suillus subaureus]
MRTGQVQVRIPHNIAVLCTGGLGITFVVGGYVNGTEFGGSTATADKRSSTAQLLHFTRNRLAPSTIRAFLCLGAWGRSALLAMEDLLASVRS